MLWLMIFCVLGIILLFNEIVYFRKRKAILKLGRIGVLFFIIATCCFPIYLEKKVLWLSIWLAIWLCLIAFLNFKDVFSASLLLCCGVMCFVFGNYLTDIIYDFYQFRSISKESYITNLDYKDDSYVILKKVTFEKGHKYEGETMSAYFYYPEGDNTAEIYCVPVKDTKITYIEEGEKAYLETIEKNRIYYDFRNPEEIKKSEFVECEYLLHIPEGSIKREN